MPEKNIIYQANQEILGKHIQSKEWIIYSGRLTVYDREINPVILSLKCELPGSFTSEYMEDKKQIKGKSISEVFGKVSKWYLKNDIIFQN